MLALAALRCGDGTETPGARFVSDGTGASSSSPLWPIAVGSRYVFHESGELINAFVEGHRISSGQDVLRVAVGGSTNYYATGEAGVLLYGSSADGDLARPVLIVPSTVRVGMKWEVDVDGKGRDYELEVVSRDEGQSTAFGPATVWTIVQRGLASGVLVERRYAEGFGPLSVKTGTGEFDMQGTELKVAVLPQSEQRSVPPAEPTIALEPAFDGPVALELEPRAFTALQATDDQLQIAVQGYTLVFEALRYVRVKSGACVAARIQSGSSGFEVTAGADVIMEAALGSTAANQCPNDLNELSWQWAVGHASEALVEGDTATWVSRPEMGAISLVDGSDDVPFALYRDAEAGPVVLWIEPTAKARAIGYVKPVSSGPSEYETARGADNLLGLGAFSLFGHRSTIDGNGLRTLHPVAQAADGMPLVLETATGLLLQSRLPVGALPTMPRIDGSSGARLSVRTAADDREFVLTSADGTIDRLVVGPDGTRRERLGTVRLPAGHHLVGALRIGGFGEPAPGDPVLVATYDGSDIPDYAQMRNDIVGDVYLWQGELDQTPAPVTPPASLAISATAAGTDAVVCWRDTGEAPDLTGWTLGGAAVAAAVPTRPDCLLLVRDLDAAPPWGGLEDEGGNFVLDREVRGQCRITGTVPGVGPVTIGVDAPPTPAELLRPVSDVDLAWDVPMRGTETHVAALADGTFVNGPYLFSSGMVVESTSPVTELPEVELETYGGRPSRYVPDPRGHGLWVVYGSGGQFWLALSSRSAPVAVPTGTTLAPIIGVGQQGGVVSLSGPTGAEYVAPDGTRTPVSLAGITYDNDVASHPSAGIAYLTDGSLCSVGAEANLLCVASDGTERSAPASFPLDDLTITARPLVTGELAFSSRSAGTWIVEPSTLEQRQLDARSVSLPAWAGDGTLWGLASDGQLAQITADALSTWRLPDFGPVFPKLPDANRIPQALTIIDIIVGEQIVLVQLDGWLPTYDGFAHFRVPRPR